MPLGDGGWIDLRTEVTRDRDLLKMRGAVLNDRDMQAVLIEYDRIGLYEHGWCLARDKSSTVQWIPGLSAPSGLGTSISVSSVRLPGCNAVAIRVTLPGKVRFGISGTRTTASTPGPSPKASSWGTNTWVRIT
jgi:hypothetical protein